MYLDFLLFFHIYVASTKHHDNPILDLLVLLEAHPLGSLLAFGYNILF